VGNATHAPQRAEKSLEHQSSASQNVQPRIWTIAATDLSFLWHECRRCFYRKVACAAPRPRTPFPSLFGAIDRTMTRYFLGRRLAEFTVGCPEGTVRGVGRWLCSAPIPVGAAAHIVLRRRLDGLVSDGAGATSLMDFKCTAPSHDHVAHYTRQLHAYAWALEHPGKGRPVHVDRMGLLSFSPTAFSAKAGRGSLDGALSWLEIPRDDTAFGCFLEEVGSTLHKPELPAPGQGCKWCAEARPGEVALRNTTRPFNQKGVVAT